jgi:hypothetical protein
VREVAYRGGLILFAVPDDWAEENDPAGGAAYYSDKPGSPTLRLNVTTLRPPEPVTEKHILEAASTGAQPGDPPAERLPTGTALRRFWRDGVEGATPVRVRYWALAGGAPPTTVRLALFSLTHPAGTDDALLAELDRSISAAEFTRLTAEEVAAAHRKAKPWWRPW